MSGASDDESGGGSTAGDLEEAETEDLSQQPLLLPGPGDLDQTFSADGMVTTNIVDAGDMTNRIDYAKAVIQVGLDIVVAGKTRHVNSDVSDFLVLRYTSSGDLDTLDATTFNGSAGYVQLDNPDDSGARDEGKALAVQLDGKIVLAGITTPVNGDADFAVVRLKTDGTPHEGFHDDGFRAYDFFEDDVGKDEGKSVVLDGTRIVVAGGAHNAATGYTEFGLVRFTAAGTTVYDWITNDIVAGEHDDGNKVVRQANGKLTVVGTSGTCDGMGTDCDFALARYMPQQPIALDSTFDGESGTADGAFTTDFFGGDDQAFSAAIQYDGYLVVVGSSDTGCAIARYDGTGRLDTGFRGGGKFVETVPGAAFARCTSVDIQVDGKIVVAGTVDLNVGTGLDFLVMRYETNGDLDPVFDSDGIATTDFGSQEEAYADHIMGPNGEIVVVGQTGPASALDVAVARYRD